MPDGAFTAAAGRPKRSSGSAKTISRPHLVHAGWQTASHVTISVNLSLAPETARTPCGRRTSELIVGLASSKPGSARSADRNSDTSRESAINAAKNTLANGLTDTGRENNRHVTPIACFDRCKSFIDKGSKTSEFKQVPNYQYPGFEV